MRKDHLAPKTRQDPRFRGVDNLAICVQNYGRFRLDMVSGVLSWAWIEKKELN